mgnify:CR=1 FL=1
MTCCVNGLRAQTDRRCTRRGQKSRIRTRESNDGGKSPRFAPVMINLKDDGGKNAGFAHADGHAAAAELTPLRSVRPSYRLLRPRCRENLYPAGTSHFPRPWAGHVRRAARPFGYFGYIGKGNEKRWSRFSATLCVYQLIRCYSFTQRTGQLDAKYLLSSTLTSLRVFG